MEISVVHNTYLTSTNYVKTYHIFVKCRMRNVALKQILSQSIYPFFSLENFPLKTCLSTFECNILETEKSCCIRGCLVIGTPCLVTIGESNGYGCHM